MTTEAQTQEDDLRAQFGKPRDSGGINIITVEKDGSKTVRLLPPMKSLKDLGQWGVYHRQHYGYSVRDNRDPTKTRMRPFGCIEETDENKLVVVSCAECRKREEVQQRINDNKALETKKFLDAGLSPKEAEARANEAVKEDLEWLDAHNLDKKWFIPIMLEDSSFGVLKVPHAAKKAIDKARRKLKEEENRDVFDVDAGAWLKITRTGTGRETDYDANVVKMPVEVNGQRFMATKSAPLSSEQLRSALALPDVSGSAIIRKLTKEQIRILADGGGSPDEVESVLNLGQKDNRQAPAPAPVQSRPAPAAPKPAPAQAAVQTTPTPAAPVEEDEEAKLERQLREARARKASAKALAQAPATAPVAAPQALDPDISDDEFAARFPPPK